MKPLVSVKWDDLETSSRGRNFGQCLNIIYAKVLLRGSLDRCQENYQNNVPERVEKVLSKKQRPPIIQFGWEEPKRRGGRFNLVGLENGFDRMTGPL